MREQDIELRNLSASTSRQHSPTLSGKVGEFETIHENKPDLLHEHFTSHETIPEWAGLVKNLSWSAKIRFGLRKVWRGPDLVRDLPPRPIQSLRFLERLPSKLKTQLSFKKLCLIFAAYLTLWLLLWANILLPYLTDVPTNAEGTQVVSLTCGGAELFWKGKNAACGLDAKNCVPEKDVIIRCPALCDRGSWLYSLRAVGDNIVKYRGYFIGGGNKQKHSKNTLSGPYRADSYPCGAAVHAGLVSPFLGGCARLSYSSGPQQGFGSMPGHYGVSDSIGFASFFPYSYVFQQLSTQVPHCYDPRLLVLVINIILGLPVVYFGSGPVFYWTMAIVGFWTIVSATDPPVQVPENAESLYRLISIGLERFLPTCFVLYALWELSVKRTFGKSSSKHDSRSSLAETLFLNEESTILISESPLSRVFLWYPFFWLSVLNNLTFDRLPVDRLTWHDLQEQPGALITFSVISVILVICIVAQAYYVWLLGRFWKLLLVYAAMFASFFILASLPGLTLRIHHYIFGLLFIPGCATKGRTAYAFQGILLGFFLSGVARWGYASIAETNLSLLRGEPLGQLQTPEITGFSLGLLYWKSSLYNDTQTISTRISLIINDVERYRGESSGTVNVSKILHENSDIHSFLDTQQDITNTPIYLRLAMYLAEQKAFGDYTRAAVLKYPSFEFETPPPGIT